MGKDKNIFKNLKNSMMLSCETATLLITKAEFEPLKCSEKIRLQFHLASCKFCRRFKSQSAIISQNIKNISHPDNIQFVRKLSEEQKKNISMVLEKEIRGGD